MAVGTVLFSFSFILLIIGYNAHSVCELDVLHTPNSLEFGEGLTSPPESYLKEIYSVALGLPVEFEQNQGIDWRGMKVRHPFRIPEAVVEFYVDGGSNISQYFSAKTVKIPLEPVGYEPRTFDDMKYRINYEYGKTGKLLDLDLASDKEVIKTKLFGVFEVPKLSDESFIESHLEPENAIFQSEIKILNSIANQLSSGAVKPDNIPDFYYIKTRALHDLRIVYGAESEETKEATRTLAKAIDRLSQAFVEAYKGSVLFTVVTSENVGRRVIRDVTKEELAPGAAQLRQGEGEGEVQAEAQAEAPAAEADTGDSDLPSPHFAAMFNIFLWFSVIFVFALISVAYAIMDMDPGRDSIIYRMTSTRMKKE